MKDITKLTKQQTKVLGLIYTFRFVTAPLLADVLRIRRYSIYEVLETLVAKDQLVKVYDSSWKIDRKPALYYLSKQGATTVRKLLDLPPQAINSIYQDHRASQDFITECLNTIACYSALSRKLPDGTIIRTRTELNQYSHLLPKHPPQLYIHTPDNQEAFILILPTKLPYFVNKRREEYITHSEDEGWEGSYPTVAFILKDPKTRYGFLYNTKQALENLGIDEDCEGEITILTTDIETLKTNKSNIWSDPWQPKQWRKLLH